MMRKGIRVSVVLMSILLSAGAALGQAPAATLDLYIEEALERNPEIRALEKNAAAARAEVPRAGALPDPVLKLGLMNLPVNSFDFDQEPMTGKQAMLTQRVPFPGTLGLQTDISRQMTTMAEAQLRAKENEITRKVKEVVFNLAYLKRAIRLTEENRTTIDQFLHVAQKKYEVGGGLQQDVLRAQVELSKMNEKIILLQREERSLKAMLNTLVDRPPGDSVDGVPTLAPTPVGWSEDSLVALAQEHNPTLAVMRAQIETATSMRKLAKKSYLPHFDFSVAYTQRENIMDRTMHDFFSAQVGVNLPLWFWRKQNKKVEEAGYRMTQAHEAWEAARNTVSLQIADLEIEREENERLIDLYRNAILPQGEQSLDAALTAYEVNKVDFLTLLTIQQRLFDDEMAYERVVANHEVVLAKIEEVVGKRVF